MTATQTPGSITVYTGGLSPTVTVTLHGSNATLFSDQACTVSQANPFMPSGGGYFRSVSPAHVLSMTMCTPCQSQE